MSVATIQLPFTPLEETALFFFPSLRKAPGFAHAITSRPWNMATHCGPAADRAVARRRRVCEFLGLPFENLTAPEQTHSPYVLSVLPSEIGAGRDGRHTAIRFVDGLVCHLPGVALMQFSADCPLILFVEPSRRILATAHASWRCTVCGIVEEVVRQLRGCFEIDPAKLHVGISPCAGPERYEVGEDVRRIARTRLPEADRFFRQNAETIYFDLRAANVDQLLRCGIPAGHVTVAAECTLSDDRFYSHRREGSQAGRFALVAGFLP